MLTSHLREQKCNEILLFLPILFIKKPLEPHRHYFNRKAFDVTSFKINRVLKVLRKEMLINECRILAAYFDLT